MSDELIERGKSLASFLSRIGNPKDGETVHSLTAEVNSLRLEVERLKTAEKSRIRISGDLLKTARRAADYLEARGYILWDSAIRQLIAFYQDQIEDKDMGAKAPEPAPEFRRENIPVPPPPPPKRPDASADAAQSFLGTPAPNVGKLSDRQLYGVGETVATELHHSRLHRAGDVVRELLRRFSARVFEDLATRPPETPDRLYQLPDGNWLDLGRIASIHAFNFEGNKHFQAEDRYGVWIYECFDDDDSPRSVFHFDTHDEAMRVRDEIARAANAYHRGRR